MKLRFKEKADNLEVERNKAKKKSNSLSNFRGLTMVAIAIILCTIFFDRYTFLRGIILIILVLTFVYFVYKHSIAIKELKWIERLIEVNKKYVDRISGQWKSFSDKGEEYCNEEHFYGMDLDIVGRNSLFQLINITNTFKGREKLAKVLLGDHDSIGEIVKRQQAVKDLGEKLDFVQQLEASGIKSSGITKKPDELIDFSSRKNFAEKIGFISIVRYIPVILIAMLLINLFIRVQLVSYIAVGLFVVQILFNIYGAMKFSKDLDEVGIYSDDLTTYKNIIKVIEKENFDAPYLKELSKKIAVDENGGKKSIEALEKVSRKIAIRNNALIYFPLNLILLLDYRFIYNLEKWRKNYGVGMDKILEYIGEIEMLASLSVLIHTEECSKFPIFKEEKGIVEGKNLGHPLINREKRVSNDINISNKIFIITGSNMAGKTTILRTIGINMVLAYAGAPICGESMNCSMMDIFTSMRIGDNLGEGISTFYAELLKIKEIIAFSKEEKPMIFLMDEIFRGTNSLDRIVGAETVVKTLDRPWIIGGIATHDFELCHLDENSRIENYHFSENYENDNIVFDYKIKKGKATTTNAQFLMKMVGLEI